MTTAAWIKMRTNLWNDPRVSGLCDATGQREATVIGALYWLWATADEHSVDGVLQGQSVASVDRKSGVKGIAAALLDIGWIEDTPDGVRILRFDEHNGASAKRRATDAHLKANRRHGVDEMSASDADKPPTKSGQEAVLEKEREREKRKPPNPRKRGNGARFDDFWLAWPKNERKQDKAKCLDHWRLHDLDKAADAIAADVRTKRGTEKWQGGHIEAPLTYLRGRRWEDGQEPNGTLGGAVVAWDRDGGTIRAKGTELGLGDWNRDAFEHGEPDAETFQAYTRRVRDALEAQPA